MKKMLINTNNYEEIRIALVENDLLYDLYIENFNNEQKKNNIYKGKITHIEKSLNAVFVDYGQNKHGFMPIKETFNNLKNKNNNFLNNLKIGENLLVQVIKEERNNKCAVLTNSISLAGSYLVLIPNNIKTIGISKRIGDKDKKKIKDLIKNLILPKNIGIIFRTSSVGKTLNDLQNDLDSKLKHWLFIKKIYKKKKNPSLISKENNIFIKIFRDYLTPDISEIIIDNSNFIKDSKKYLIKLNRKDFLNKIKLHINNIPIFGFYKIESQIESAYKKNIKLSSGGLITIDYTEALISIDVNSYKYTKGADIEETALNTNLEAIIEISKQLRLRDIGGLIIIDFIDMKNKKNCKYIEDKFKILTYIDKAKIRFGNISKFGILEMTRQRLTNSLNEYNYYICKRCNGNGYIRNHKSISLLILRLIEEKLIKNNIKKIQIITSISISTYLINEKRYYINNIEKLNNIKITIIPNNIIKTPNYIINIIYDNDIKNGENNTIYNKYCFYKYKNNINKKYLNNIKVNNNNIYKNYYINFLLKILKKIFYIIKNFFLYKEK